MKSVVFGAEYDIDNHVKLERNILDTSNQPFL